MQETAKICKFRPNSHATQKRLRVSFFSTSDTSTTIISTHLRSDPPKQVTTCTNGGADGGAFTCSAPYYALKANSAAIACPSGTCTDLLCCDPSCQIGGVGETPYKCPTGYTAKANLASIACTGGCVDATCCDRRILHPVLCFWGCTGVGSGFSRKEQVNRVH